MNRKKLVACAVILILTLTLVGSMNTDKVFSVPEPTVFVDPVGSTAAPTQTFSIRINVSDVTAQRSLFGWELQMSYNSTVLEISGDPIEGPFLKQASPNTFFLFDISTPGVISAGNSFLPVPQQGAYGSGTLAIITFRAKTQGISALHFEYTYLYDKTVQDIPHTDVDGFFKYPVIHDVAVTNVFVSPTHVTAGQSVTINATVENEGDVPETFNVAAYRNNTIIDTIQVTLTNGTSTNATFTWDTADVTSGNYTIKAEVPPLQNETDTGDNTLIKGWVIVIVGNRPYASFTFSPQTPQIDQLVTFNSTSYDTDGNIVSWRWDINGDSIIEATTENTTYTYDALGTYSVTLNVTDNSGLWNTTSHSIIVGKRLSSISINALPSTIKIEESTTITGIIAPAIPDTAAAEVTIWYKKTTESTWTNLTTVTTNSSSQYRYTWIPSTLGKYDLKANWTGTTQTHPAESTFAAVTVNKPPEAKFSYMPSSPKVNDEVEFDASSSTPNGGTIQTYTWNFGDANITDSTSFKMTHTYAVSGDYNVTLTVTDTEGQSDTTWQLVNILQSPIAIFTVTPEVTPEEPLVGQTLTFDATDSNDLDGSISSYVWDFGDGTNGTGPTVQHKFTKAGTYEVKLTVKDNDQLTDIATDTIRVQLHDIAVISVKSTPSMVIKGEPVTITVIVANEGTFTQTFDVSVYYETTLIETQQVTLSADTYKPITFMWNTTNVAEGEFSIAIKAEIVSGETETTNNQLTGESVTVQAEEIPSPPPSSDILPYAIVAMVIIVLAAAIAIYFFKYRK